MECVSSYIVNCVIFTKIFFSNTFHKGLPVFNTNGKLYKWIGCDQMTITICLNVVINKYIILFYWVI